jgi:outer membrane biosynthesis protein TonB
MAAAGVALIGMLVFALRGKPVEKPPEPKAPEAVQAPEPPKAEAPKAEPPKAEPPKAEAPPAEVPKAEPPAPEPRPLAKPERTRPAVEPPAEAPPRRLRGKKVVLEYDRGTPPPASSAPVEDPALVARARDAYKRGNQRLFSGDSVGAIAAYRESLEIYPGYVGGYRGLGLAYAEKGETAEALKALKTYAKTVPNAHDVPLIKKRIEHLESSK